MNRKTLSLMFVLFSSTSLTAQEMGVWHSSWGPGTQVNYSVETADGTQLIITCKDAEPVSMYAAVKGRDYGTDLADFKLMVDGNEYVKPPYHLAEFDKFWDALRQAQVLYIATANGLCEIPTEGIADALPGSNTPDYNCYTQPKHDAIKAAQANNMNAADVGKSVAIDLDQFAVEATTADMSQTQMGAGQIGADEGLSWYERAWLGIVERVEKVQQKIQRTLRKITNLFR